MSICPVCDEHGFLGNREQVVENFCDRCGAAGHVCDVEGCERDISWVHHGTAPPRTFCDEHAPAEIEAAARAGHLRESGWRAQWR